MLNPARAKSWIVASCSEPFGMPELDLCSWPLMSLERLRIEAACAAPVWQHVAVAERASPSSRARVSSSQSTSISLDLQPVAGGLALRPQLAARAAEERREPGRDGPVRAPPGS